MTGSELTGRVTTRGALAVAGATLFAAWIGGVPALVGVLAGGAIGLLHFRWLARSAASKGAALRAGRLRTGWMLAVGFRFLAAFGALATVLLTGWADPRALMAGLVVVPCVLVLVGLRAAADPS